MEYSDFLPAVGAKHPKVASQIKLFLTLEHVLDWLTTSGYPLGRLDMVTQDEYCHDLLLPLQESGDWLVFGMT